MITLPSIAAALIQAAVQAVDPALAVRGNLSRAEVAQAERVWVVGAGKAGWPMAQAALDIIGDKVAGGVIAIPSAPATEPAGPLTFIQGGHPLPTEGSLRAGQAIVDLLAQTNERDVVLALISGGGSALMELPISGMTLADLQATNTALLHSGAPIQAINVIRKTLSQIKGGGLARRAHPARVLALILSDVVGNPLDIIASGPTVITQSALTAPEVLTRYNLRATLPAGVVQVIESTEQKPVKELRVENRLIASNRIAAEAARAEAERLGFAAQVMGDDWQGEAREVGARFARLVQAQASNTMLIVGGETTVTQPGAGHGGRNQEAALAAALTLADGPPCAIVCFATDGVDGPTDAAGALVEHTTLQRAQTLGFNAHAYLSAHNSYLFFDALNDLIRTGPTGTNVNDLWFGWRT